MVPAYVYSHCEEGAKYVRVLKLTRLFNISYITLINQGPTWGD